MYVIRGVEPPGLIDEVSKKCRKEEGKVPGVDCTMWCFREIK